MKIPSWWNSKAQTPKLLLAKPPSPKDRVVPSLVRHLRDVAEVAVAMAESRDHQILKAAGIEHLAPRFVRALRAGGWFHDVGKSNGDFHAMLASGRNNIQMLRHEVISVLILLRPEIRRWLEPYADVYDDFLVGIIGHHRKFLHKTTFKARSEIPDDPKMGGMTAKEKAMFLPLNGDMTIYTTHRDFGEMLEEIGVALSLPPAPLLGKRVLPEADAAGKLDALKEELTRAARGKIHMLRDRTYEYSTYLGLVKGTLIAADVAASALIQAAEGPEEAVRKLLGGGMTVEDADALIGVYLRRKFSNGFPGYNSMQAELAGMDANTVVVIAGCGSGKSLGAYLWVRRWLRHGPKNVFFFFPTTGTASEHYRDYAADVWKEKHRATLVHSRAKCERSRTKGKRPVDVDGEKADIDTMDGFRAVGDPLTVATVDSGLGMLCCRSYGLTALPALTNGVCVFDEAHDYDDKMFGLLLVFLRRLPNIPVLVMTASMPTHRLDALRSVRPGLSVVRGPAEFEDTPRYDIGLIPSVDDVGSYLHLLRDTRKGLVIRNQVGWAVDTWRALRDALPNHNVRLYHARYKHKDRGVIHGDVINDFNKDRPTVLVATQVAQISLDISADVLVSDVAPPPDVVQRMGRAARRLGRGSQGPTAICLFGENALANPLPYQEEGVAAGHHLVQLLCGRGQTQRRVMEEMVGVMERLPYDIDVEKSESHATLFWGDEVGWQTRIDDPREEGHTVTVVREEDLPVRGEPEAAWMRQNEIQIPWNSKKMSGWERRVLGILVAPTGMIDYDFNPSKKEGIGASWAK